MHRLLALAIVAMLGLGVTALLTGAADQPAGLPAGFRTATSALVGEAPLADDQVEVRGHVTTMRAAVERSEPISTPFAVDVAERGRGGATITGALIDGQRTSIVWQAPSPLLITGVGGALLPGPTVLRVGDDLTWELDHSGHGFAPGTYLISSPVAVGSGALATPRDEVQFTADEQTTITTTGAAFTTSTPRPLRIEGPGDLTSSGVLEVRTPDGSSRATDLTFGPGSYVVQLVPSAGRWRIEMAANGPIQTS